MKKVLFLLYFIILMLASSCSTDFQLEGEWKDVPIVYAFLNVQDTAHYVRVEKAFLEPGGNAQNIAQIADSLYYDNITVQIEKVNTGQVFTLQEVNGNEEGYPREEGAFAQDPNILYKIRQSEIELGGGEPVRLLLDRGEGLPIVTAETTVLGVLEPIESRPGNEISLQDYDRNLNIAWNAGQEARLFDVRFIVKYRESDPENGGSFLEKELEWVLVRELRREENTNTERVTYTIEWGEFYKFMNNQIDASVSRSRIFTGLDLFISGAGEELDEFLTVADANIGITSSQAIPVYSNLSEGFGVFTSRSSVLRQPTIRLRSAACDSLETGIYTGNLDFTGCE